MMMKMFSSLLSGLSFGLMSGVLTTLGLVVGLHSGTNSKAAVLAGILTIAVADALSDSLGIHLAQEAQPGATGRKIWSAATSTFVAKLVFALTFAIPVLFLDLFWAVAVSVVWGMLAVGVYSFLLAKKRQQDPRRAVLEHLLLAAGVVIVAHFVGEWVDSVFDGPELLLAV